MENIYNKQWWVDTISPMLLGSKFEVKINPCERENCVIIVLKEEYREHKNKKDHYIAVKPYKTSGYSAWMKMEVYTNASYKYQLPEPNRIHSNMPHFTKLQDNEFILNVVRSLVESY